MTSSSSTTNIAPAAPGEANVSDAGKPESDEYVEM